MQVSNIGTKEQLDAGNNGIKSASVQLTGDFLSFMKDMDIMAKSENSYMSNQVDKKPASNPEKDVSSDKKEDNYASSKSDSKDTSSTEAKKDTSSSKKDKVDKDSSADVAQSKDNNNSDNDQYEVVDDVVGAAQNNQTSEPIKTSVSEVGANANTTKSVGDVVDPDVAGVQAKAQENSVPVAGKNQNAPVEDIVGEKNAGQNLKSDSVLPRTEASSAQIPLASEEDADSAEVVPIVSTKKVLEKLTDINAYKNQKNPVAQTDVPVVKVPENTSEEVLQQAEILADKIGKDIKNPIKVNIDITKPEATQATMSQETLSVLNKDMEIKTQTNSSSVKNVVQTSQDVSTLAETETVQQKTFTSTLSTVAKMAREQILGKEPVASQVKDTKLPTNEIGVGFAISDDMKISSGSSSNSDSDILLMSKTYAGKATGSNVNKAAVNAKQQLATPKQVIDQIKVQIKQTNAADKITVKLNPKELGQVELKVEVSKSGSMNVEITANKKETLELLKQDIKYLEKALQETVAKSESTPNFTFNLKGETNQGHAQNGHGQSGKEAGQGNNQQQASNDNVTDENAKPLEYKRSGISIKV